MSTARSEVGRPHAVGALAGADANPLGLHRHLLVSERLRVRRRQLGLTQKEVVARLRRLGVDTTNKSLSSLEHGAGLDVCKLPELARALDCTLTYLVGLSSDPLSWEPDRGTWSQPWVDEARVNADQVRRPEPREGGGPWILGPTPTFHPSPLSRLTSFASPDTA